jgi:hypothetical protein
MLYCSILSTPAGSVLVRETVNTIVNVTHLDCRLELLVNARGHVWENWARINTRLLDFVKRPRGLISLSLILHIGYRVLPVEPSAPVRTKSHYHHQVNKTNQTEIPIHILSPCSHFLHLDCAFLIPFNRFALFTIN